MDPQRIHDFFRTSPCGDLAAAYRELADRGTEQIYAAELARPTAAQADFSDFDSLHQALNKGVLETLDLHFTHAVITHRDKGAGLTVGKVTGSNGPKTLDLRNGPKHDRPKWMSLLTGDAAKRGDLDGIRNVVLKGDRHMGAPVRCPDGMLLIRHPQGDRLERSTISSAIRLRSGDLGGHLQWGTLWLDRKPNLMTARDRTFLLDLIAQALPVPMRAPAKLHEWTAYASTCAAIRDSRGIQPGAVERLRLAADLLARPEVTLTRLVGHMTSGCFLQVRTVPYVVPGQDGRGRLAGALIVEDDQFEWVYAEHRTDVWARISELNLVGDARISGARNEVERKLDVIGRPEGLEPVGPGSSLWRHPTDLPVGWVLDKTSEQRPVALLD